MFAVMSAVVAAVPVDRAEQAAGMVHVNPGGIIAGIVGLPHDIACARVDVAANNEPVISNPAAKPIRLLPERTIFADLQAN